METTTEIQTNARELQKDRELERLRAEHATLCAHVAEYHDALCGAHKAIHEMMRGEGEDALIELLTGWPPREANTIVHAPEGTVLGKGTWIITRKS